MKAFTLGAAIALVFSATAFAQAPSWTVPEESQRCPSKWGAADERGSGNHQKPAAVMNAAKLIKTGDIAQERFTELDKVMAARQAAVDAAKDDLRTLTASVQSLRADLSLAEKRLSDTTVRAPFDAAVTERSVSPGQYIKENT